MSVSFRAPARVLKGGLLALSLAVAAGPVFAAEPAAPPAASGSVILTIRMERILAESAAGRDIGAQFEAIGKRLRAELNAAQDQLKTEEQSIAAVKSQLSREEFDKKAREFEEKVRRVGLEAVKNSDGLIAARDNALAELRRKLAPVLQGIMSARGGTIMLDETQMIIAAAELDVTGDALKGLDAAVKKIPVVFPPQADSKAAKPAAPAP